MITRIINLRLARLRKYPHLTFAYGPVELVDTVREIMEENQCAAKSMLEKNFCENQPT